MNYTSGIDLGSTTTKAVILGEAGELLGRGITNSRSNYTVACDVALTEALIHARFGLMEAELDVAAVEQARKLAALAELQRTLLAIDAVEGLPGPRQPPSQGRSGAPTP